MTISTASLWTSKTKLIILALMLALASHAVPVFAQQTGRTTVLANVNITDLRPGMWCRVTLETPPQSGTNRPVVLAGKIAEITKDDILLVTTSEFRSEKRIPVLAALPYIGRYFINASVGLEAMTHRIPLATIVAVECRGVTNEDIDTQFLERIGVDFK
ncbi:MAG: hypothetical protein ACYC4N_26775 [Pirellulaceae bacterium]